MTLSRFVEGEFVVVGRIDPIRFHFGFGTFRKKVALNFEYFSLEPSLKFVFRTVWGVFKVFKDFNFKFSYFDRLALLEPFFSFVKSFI